MEHRVLAPTAILGYGFPKQSFCRGLDRHPHVIAVDAGSTDPGPYYLGAGTSFVPRDAVKRDLSLMLDAAISHRIPLLIGSAGGSGAKPHVDWALGIIQEIATERRLSFRMGVIYSDVSQVEVVRLLELGRIRPLRSVPDLDRDTILNTIRIVAQFGIEPIRHALAQECQVIVCGRCYDPAPFAAPAIEAGFDPGLALHMGKILECGAIAATPGSGADTVLGTLHEDGFVLESMNSEREFTTTSTAAHSLYEKSDPYLLPGPGGAIDLHSVQYRSMGGGRVRVAGSRFIPEGKISVKLEGVRHVGYRTLCIAGIRDPILISQIDSVLANVKENLLPDGGEEAGGKLIFRVYGRNAVMGVLEPVQDASPHEVGVVIEAIGESQEQADSLCARARAKLLHLSYPNRLCTAGNLAFPYSPSDISCGSTYVFSIYHLLELEDPYSMFPVALRAVRG